MVTATVHGPPPQSLESIDHGMQAPRGDLLAAFLVQTSEALGVLRDGPDVCLKNDRLCWGGTDDFRQPPQVSRAPMGPARRADILAEHEGFETKRGVFEIADHLFARPCEIPDGFIVYCGDIDRGESARAGQAGQLEGITAVRCDPLPRLLGNQGRSHDPAVRAFLLEIPIEPRATRPRFVDEEKVLGFRWHLADALINITLTCADRPIVGDLSARLLCRVRDSHRLFVDIHADEECARLGHG
jgi:hypothetical protein